MLSDSCNVIGIGVIGKTLAQTLDDEPETLAASDCSIIFQNVIKQLTDLHEGRDPSGRPCAPRRHNAVTAENIILHPFNMDPWIPGDILSNRTQAVLVGFGDATREAIAEDHAGNMDRHAEDNIRKMDPHTAFVMPDFVDLFKLLKDTRARVAPARACDLIEQSIAGVDVRAEELGQAIRNCDEGDRAVEGAVRHLSPTVIAWLAEYFHEVHEPTAPNLALWLINLFFHGNQIIPAAPKTNATPTTEMSILLQKHYAIAEFAAGNRLIAKRRFRNALDNAQHYFGPLHETVIWLRRQYGWAIVTTIQELTSMSEKAVLTKRPLFFLVEKSKYKGAQLTNENIEPFIETLEREFDEWWKNVYAVDDPVKENCENMRTSVMAMHFARRRRREPIRTRIKLCAGMRKFRFPQKATGSGSLGAKSVEAQQQVGVQQAAAAPQAVNAQNAAEKRQGVEK